MRELLLQFNRLKRNERHRNNAETAYWCNQYKLFAQHLLSELLAKPDVTLISEGKTWQGLTDDEIDQVWPTPAGTNSIRSVARVIEAKLREKNNA